ncbi:hypothetical protein F885_01799 [Acinetobacter higginsii]|uniref:hypothetical protein n=1 Tax=Acinetobacter higginsii TaxID=70347 RepID=UPI0002CD7A46|nr:hypothetical protein [Acinetobacter higginsii]ENX60691.1 hypothetical protein F885_01799 [Acinetobacter higginsii]
MNNILNAQEAFNAMISGKQVMARQPNNVGNNDCFSPIEEFPTSIFVMPGIEFCIDIEKIELAGITFTQPLKLEEYQEGQDVFVISTYAPSIYVMDFNTSALVESINSGFVQRDAENAKLQLKAISKVLGREFIGDVTVTRLGKEPGKTKRKKEQQVTVGTDDSQSLQIEHNKELVIDAIGTCLTAEEVETTCFGLDKNGFNDSQQEQITAAKLAKLEQLKQEKAVAESEDHELFNQDKSEPELSVLCEAFIGEILEATTPAKLNVIHGRINTSTGLEGYEHDVLAKHLDEKLASFDAEQHTGDNKADSVNVQKNTERKPIEEDEERYQEKLITLKKYVDGAQTPAEVNAAVKYTNSWSAKQREPLIKYMHTRLETLQNEKAATQPSLMAQIQNAPDLTTLDALEIDVSSMDPIAQPEMMRYVRARRTELERVTPSTSIDEDLP